MFENVFELVILGKDVCTTRTLGDWPSMQPCVGCVWLVPSEEVTGSVFAFRTKSPQSTKKQWHTYSSHLVSEWNLWFTPELQLDTAPTAPPGLRPRTLVYLHLSIILVAGPKFRSPTPHTPRTPVDWCDDMHACVHVCGVSTLFVQTVLVHWTTLRPSRKRCCIQQVVPGPQGWVQSGLFHMRMKASAVPMSR